MKPKIAIVSVINDLVTDQRVDKTCRTVAEVGFDVLLLGRVKHDSPPMSERSYKTHRMRLLFEKGPFFYMEFNIRLFFFLLFHKSDLLFANDLDTLLPNFIIHKIRRIPIIYDSHEYFTGTPELVNRKFVQGVWKTIENWIVPKLREVITVNDSIAGLFREQFGNQIHVVRNIPSLRQEDDLKPRTDLGLPEQIPIVLLQGSGINIQRGAEELVDAMQYLNDVLLLIIGGGDVIRELKERATIPGLAGKILFLPRMPFDRLRDYTRHASIGVTIDKDTNINYRYSLPNKLFDYIHADVPILASPLVEIRKIIDQYQVGETIESHDPQAIAGKIKAMLDDTGKLELYRSNCREAAKVLNWENEKQILIKVLKKYA